MRAIKIIRPVDQKWPITANVGEINQKLWAKFHKGTDFGTPIGADVANCLEGEVQLCGEGADGKVGKRVWVLSNHPEQT